MEKRDKTITYTLIAPEVRALCVSDARLSILINHYGQLSYSLHTDPTSFFIETIVAQMLSSKAADAITARLYDLCGGKLTIDEVLELDVTAFRGIGLSRKKAEYILGLARILRSRPCYFEQLNDMPDEEIIKHLTAIHGIGSWSAKMYLIFVLDRKDVLPHEDGAFQQVYKWLYTTDDTKPSAIRQRCARWWPYSSIAARYLYRALDEGLMRDLQLSERLSTAGA